MQLIYHEERKRYEFLYTKAEMGAGYPLVTGAGFTFDGKVEPKVWYTTEARRCLKAVQCGKDEVAPASYASDELRERIMREAAGAPDPDACRMEYHESLVAPKAKGAAGFTWHAPYALNPFVKGRGWQYSPDPAPNPGPHWWTADSDSARGTLEAVAAFNQEVKEERARVRLAVSEAARAEIEAREALKRRSLVASRATDAQIELPRPAGLDYFPFQRAGIAFALERENILFGDEPGLGKTIQAVGVINADERCRRVLVVCPATLRINWRRESEKWSVRRPNILMLSGTPSSASADLIPRLFDTLRRNGAEVDIAIINFDVLKRWQAVLSAVDWDLIVIDEAHKAKGGKKTQRGQACLALAKRARRRLLLTGTPLPNKVAELLPLLEMLDAVKIFGSGWKFLERYAGAYQDRFGWHFDGATNLEELQDKLRGSVMVRRLKSEVLKELPPKRRQIIELPAVTSRQKSLIEQEARAERAQQKKRAELRAQVELAKAFGTPADYTQAVNALKAGMSASFEEISRLRHETALEKLPQAIEHIEDMLEGTGKLIVGAHHRDVLEKLLAHFNEKRERAVILYGGMSDADKQASVDRFQNDPTCNLFLGSILAAGVGLTLTAASNMCLVELDWVPANVSQFEDRFSRIGQKASSLLVQHLVLEGSIDARMAHTLIQKQEIADRALDRETGTLLEAPAELPEDAEDVELVLPEKREAGYAPEEVRRVSWANYEDRPATHGVTQEQISLEALKLSAAECETIHRALRELAGVCDGAVTRDDVGFNGTDSRIGKALAARDELNPKAAALGKHLIRKYRHTQLGGRYDSLFGKEASS